MVRWLMGSGFILALSGLATSGEGPTQPDAKDVQAVVDKAIAYLKTSQGKDGSFSPKVAGPGLPALVVAGLVRNGLSPKDPLVAKALEYMEANVQKDGGIYNKFLANYVTSVAVMGFKEANTGGKYDEVLKNAQKFLKGIQKDLEESDPAHGGFGYDGKKRPDLSNTNFAVEALIAAGVPKDDPAILKALKFISRSQQLASEHNDLPFAKKAGKDDVGGFIYNPLEADKAPEGGLRSLGGMTYGGLKSFLYAGVSKDDPRVKAALNWIRNHYTLENNPGMKQAGLYYYYHTFAKAMDALGEDPFVDAAGKKHHWRMELFEVLKKRQQSDGSWRNEEDKVFGEGNADLATSFALLSLSYTRKK